MLEVTPAMGEAYELVYESAMPDHEVRVTFIGHYGVYYTIVAGGFSPMRG